VGQSGDQRISLTKLNHHGPKRVSIPHLSLPIIGALFPALAAWGQPTAVEHAPSSQTFGEAAPLPDYLEGVYLTTRTGQAYGVPDTTASDNWVVDGAHSVTGKPLLANDPHLTLGAPGPLHLIHVTVPGVMSWNFITTRFSGNSGFSFPNIFSRTRVPSSPLWLWICSWYPRVSSWNVYCSASGLPNTTLG